MTPVPSVTRVYVAVGPTDMRKDFKGRSALSQELPKKVPFRGDLFVFRHRKTLYNRWVRWAKQGMWRRMH